MSILTEITLRNLKAPSRGQVFCADDSLAGFGVRVSQGGTKTFSVRFGIPRQRITIGRYPIISLSDARKRAREILAEYTLGKGRPKSIGFDEAVELFLEDHRQRNRARTIRDYSRILKTRFPFKSRKLSDIGSQDIVRCLSKLERTPTERRYATVVIKMFFRWAVLQRYIDHSPCDAIVPGRLRTRSRVLSDVELKSIWQACDGAFGDIVKLLMLTGQRRGEIGALEHHFPDIGKMVVTLPDTLCKNGREHSFPIGKSATSILRSVLSTAHRDKSTFLFPARGNPSAPFSGWSKCKAELDETSGVKDWTLHDLRRTFSTRLAETGTPPHIIERLLNHVSGQISGVSAIYNRASYLPEMREAVAKWEKHLSAVVSGHRHKRAA